MNGTKSGSDSLLVNTTSGSWQEEENTEKQYDVEKEEKLKGREG